jgi:hypothetical protein
MASDRISRDHSTADFDHARRDELPAFHHKPLGQTTKSVRLLEVLPGLACEPIKCMLSQHDLDDEPSYLALSYTWDRDGRTRTIECDGTRLDIGYNLWMFLCKFRTKQMLRQYYGKGSQIKSPRIWIDAMCIDQTNMEVYTTAESVIVWLGPARHREDLAFVLTKHHYLRHVDELQSELIKLLKNPYFTRVWVNNHITSIQDPY